MIPFINLANPLGSAWTDIFPSEACNISIANSTSAVSLTSISAENTTEKFIIPARYLVQGGRVVTLDLVMTYRNNEGNSRAVTLGITANGATALPAIGSGVGSAIPSGTWNRSCLLRTQIVRTGATAGTISVEWQIGGGATFTSGTFARAHNTAMTLPEAGVDVTLAVTATLAAASSELTLTVDRRHAYLL